MHKRKWNVRTVQAESHMKKKIFLSPVQLAYHAGPELHNLHNR